MCADPKNSIRHWWLDYLFEPLRSALIKAGSKTFVKLTPGLEWRNRARGSTVWRCGYLLFIGTWWLGPVRRRTQSLGWSDRNGQGLVLDQVWRKDADRCSNRSWRGKLVLTVVKIFVIDFKPTLLHMYKRTDSGSQRLVLGDPQNRILHNLATHLLHYMYSTCTKTQVLTNQIQGC